MEWQPIKTAPKEGMPCSYLQKKNYPGESAASSCTLMTLAAGLSNCNVVRADTTRAGLRKL